MRVYLFNVDNGLYEGEDFCDLKEAREEEGITTLSPPAKRSGEVPVFDRNAGCWKLIPSDRIGLLK